MRNGLRAPSLALLAIASLALIAGACNGESKPAISPTPEVSPSAGASPTAGGSPTAAGSPTAQSSPGTSATGNQFPNGGFEDGREPWYSLKPPDFILSSDIAHSGAASAHLQMREGTDAEGAKVFYLVQEITPEEFPEVLSGYYRVENWKKGTRKQYLQFVVIVFGADNAPGNFPNHQIRYPLAGIDSPPFPIGNAKFLFIGRDEPVQGEWVPFERNVRQDFIDVWGAVPEGFDKIRVLFEVRYDDKKVGEGPVEGDVYYDDLYFGPPQ
jgi:hypothetical protein